MEQVDGYGEMNSVLSRHLSGFTPIYLTSNMNGKGKIFPVL
jgi:hypothetical protein